MMIKEEMIGRFLFHLSSTPQPMAGKGGKEELHQDTNIPTKERDGDKMTC